MHRQGNDQQADSRCTLHLDPYGHHTSAQHRGQVADTLSGRAYDLRHCQQTGRSLGHPGYDRRNITVMAHEHHHHEHEGEALEYGISTFVWQTRKPLDLKKFTNLLNNYPNVIRTKGYVWFDNQPDSAYLFEQAGKLNSLTEDSLWIASAPKQDQIDLLKANPQLAQSWDEEYGDRINQLVFIGKNMNEEQIKRQFNDCLA